LLERKGGADAIRRAAEARRNDLLVYLGLANLKRKVPFGHLSPRLRLDVREFFGNYQKALGQGLELLYAAGDPGEIELACEDLKLGWQDEQALYVHRNVVDLLPGVLRAYVGCATALFGDVAQADIVKTHKTSGKVTFLVYDDFDGKALPELQHRVKVNLKTRWVQAFDHREAGQLLYFKERFVSPDHPRLAEMTAFSTKLRKLGIGEQVGFGPTKSEFLELLQRHGLNENLNRKRVGSVTKGAKPGD
jgi:DNA phosphorothioation-associated putative methyltransferase